MKLSNPGKKIPQIYNEQLRYQSNHAKSYNKPRITKFSKTNSSNIHISITNEMNTQALLSPTWRTLTPDFDAWCVMYWTGATFDGLQTDKLILNMSSCKISKKNYMKKTQNKLMHNVC